MNEEGDCVNCGMVTRNTKKVTVGREGEKELFICPKCRRKEKQVDFKNQPILP